MHLHLQLVHKVPDHVDGCAAMRVWARATLERVRKEAGNTAVWRPQQQLHKRILAHFRLLQRDLSVMSDNVITDKPSSTM